MDQAAPRADRATGAPGVRVHGFALLSGLGWLIDFAVFNALAWSGVPLFGANCVGAVCGVSFVFVTARRFIFRDVDRPLAQAVAMYAAWNGLAIIAASWAVAWVAGLIAPLVAWGVDLVGLPMAPAALVPPAAKIAVTPVTMYLNYVAMGAIVERRLSLL